MKTKEQFQFFVGLALAKWKATNNLETLKKDLRDLMVLADRLRKHNRDTRPNLIRPPTGTQLALSSANGIPVPESKAHKRLDQQ